MSAADSEPEVSDHSPDEAFERIDSSDSFARWFIESGNYSAAIRLLLQRKKSDEQAVASAVNLAIATTWLQFARIRVDGRKRVFWYVVESAKNNVLQEASCRINIAPLPERFDPPSADDPNSAPGVRMEDAERDAEVQGALDHLSPRNREVVRRYFVEGQSAEEVAEAMGLTPENVRKICQRARQILREILGGSDE